MVWFWLFFFFYLLRWFERRSYFSWILSASGTTTAIMDWPGSLEIKWANFFYKFYNWGSVAISWFYWLQNYTLSLIFLCRSNCLTTWIFWKIYFIFIIRNFTNFVCKARKTYCLITCIRLFRCWLIIQNTKWGCHLFSYFKILVIWTHAFLFIQRCIKKFIFILSKRHHRSYSSILQSFRIKILR